MAWRVPQIEILDPDRIALNRTCPWRISSRTMATVSRVRVSGFHMPCHARGRPAPCGSTQAEDEPPAGQVGPEHGIVYGKPLTRTARPLRSSGTDPRRARELSR